MNYYLKSASFLARLLDNRFRVFGFRFGLDPLIGLVPGFGDVLSLLLSIYILWIGINLKLPPNRIGQMVLNILIDFALGLIPVIGDISDFVYKANSRNLKIIEQHMQK